MSMDVELQKKIKEAYNSGQPLSEFMNDISAYYNKLKQEAEQKESAEKEKDKYIDDILDVFDRNYDSDALTYSDVGSIAAYVAYQAHPEWSLQTLKAYRDEVSHITKDAANYANMTAEEAISGLVSDIMNQLQEALGEDAKKIKQAVKKPKITLEDWVKTL